MVRNTGTGTIMDRTLHCMFVKADKSRSSVVNT